MAKKSKQETQKDKEKREKPKEKLSQAEYEKKVKELGKEGLTSEKIGQKLRDDGIHPKEYSGKISEVLGDLYVNPDLKNVEKKLERIENHYKKNLQDKKAKREKDRVFSQARKIRKYLGIALK
jgi:ribosomal protein S15P/S13E